MNTLAKLGNAKTPLYRKFVLLPYDAYWRDVQRARAEGTPYPTHNRAYDTQRVDHASSSGIPPAPATEDAQTTQNHPGAAAVVTDKGNDIKEEEKVGPPTAPSSTYYFPGLPQPIDKTETPTPDPDTKLRPAAEVRSHEKETQCVDAADVKNIVKDDSSDDSNVPHISESKAKKRMIITSLNPPKKSHRKKPSKVIKNKHTKSNDPEFKASSKIKDKAGDLDETQATTPRRSTRERREPKRDSSELYWLTGPYR